MTRTGTARFRDKRELILDAAARLFNAQGVKGGMLSEVAADVGLATNSLTYYYRRKEDLAAACLLKSIETMGSTADAASRERTLRGRVQGFVERYLARLADIADGRHPELILFSDVLTLGEPHHDSVTGAYTQLFRRVRALLDATDAPRLGPAARNARAHLLLSSISWARAWLQRHESADYPRVAARLGDLLLSGLAAPGCAAGAPASVPLPPLAPPDADDATRGAYLRAATRLVNEQGYHGASVDRIAAELQLTKGSFYHHHETKEELIGACFERTFAVLRAAQDAALDAPGRGLDRVAAVCDALLRFQLGEQGPLLRITAWTGLPEGLRRDMRRTMARLGDRFGMLVIAGMADGSLRIVDPTIAAQMVNGMLNAAAEIERWVPGVGRENAFTLFALPLLHGLHAGDDHPAPAALGSNRTATAP